MRARYESIRNQARAGLARDEGLVTFRTTLLGVYRGEGWSIGADVRDARAYDIDAGSAVSINEVNAVELIQAYVRVGDEQANLQAGRFVLDLGSRRLVADDDYRNATNSFTGIIGRATFAGGWTGALFYTLPRLRLPEDAASVRRNSVHDDRESFDLRMSGGTIARPALVGDIDVDATVLRLDERDGGRATRDRRLTTASVRLLRRPARRRLDGEVELFGQTGRVSTSLAASAPRIPVRAWSAHGEIGYSIAVAWSPRVSVEFDAASGDGRGRRFGRFDTLFGSRRPDTGPSGIYNSVGRANLIAPGVRVEIEPGARVNAFLSYRELWLARRTDAFSTTGVVDPSGASGSHAGRQLEARVRWWALPQRLQLEIDAALLDKGRFLRTAPNAPAGGSTRYVSLNASMSF